MASLLGGLSRRQADAPPPAAPEPVPDAGAAARMKLRQAQGHAADTGKAAQEARWLLERAQGHVSSCCASLDRFADLDGRVAEAGRAALQAGGPAGRAALSAEMLADRAARAAALEDHADSLATAALLEGDAGAAAAADAEARDVLRAAADLVAQCVGLQVVAELRRHEQAAGELRGLLAGLTTSRTSADGPVMWPITQVSLDRQHVFLVDNAGPGWREAGTRWTALRAALALDADAELPDAALPLPPWAA